MPSREEERSLNKKSDMRYCTVHQVYYYAEFGCQQCVFVDFKPKINSVRSVELKKCLKCGRISLFWNSQNEIYECLNKKCKRQFTPKQVAEAEAKGETAINIDKPRKKKGKSSKERF
ncbi:hypothetical protein ACFLVP_00450 [Chloroflexota bacterium]